MKYSNNLYSDMDTVAIIYINASSKGSADYYFYTSSIKATNDRLYVFNVSNLPWTLNQVSSFHFIV